MGNEPGRRPHPAWMGTGRLGFTGSAGPAWEKAAGKARTGPPGPPRASPLPAVTWQRLPCFAAARERCTRIKPVHRSGARSGSVRREQRGVGRARRAPYGCAASLFLTQPGGWAEGRGAPAARALRPACLAAPDPRPEGSAAGSKRVRCDVRRGAATHSAGQERPLAEAEATQRFRQDVHALRICNGCTGLFRAAPFWFKLSVRYDVAIGAVWHTSASDASTHPHARDGPQARSIATEEACGSTLAFSCNRLRLSEIGGACAQTRGRHLSIRVRCRSGHAGGRGTERVRGDNPQSGVRGVIRKRAIRFRSPPFACRHPGRCRRTP